MNTNLRRGGLVLAATLLLATTACSSSAKSSSADNKNDADGATTTTSVVPAPSGLPEFYSVPMPLPTKPGTVIKSEKVDAPDVHGTVYRVMYVSQTVYDKPVAVTGLIAVPNGTPPDGGWPVVSWAHGTNGMADQCAESLKPNQQAALANILLDKGWIIAATDYEGEGTPGLHPYIAGIAAARNTVDIVRAARNIDETKASDNYVVWGHSQGGHTAMHASQIATDYAPELHPKGVVAGAPPSQFNYIYNFLKTSPYRYYLLMAGGGLNAEYGDDAAPLDEILTPEGEKLIPELDKTCAGGLSDKFGKVDVSTVTKVDPFTVPKWKKILEENDPQQFKTKSPIPLLIIQGGNDEQIPVVSTKLLADHLCEIGQEFSRWVYPGQSHAGVIAPSANDMVDWISSRFAGEANPNSAEPKGAKDIDVIRCPES
jgi:acetyl esterase/lipase